MGDQFTDLEHGEAPNSMIRFHGPLGLTLAIIGVMDPRYLQSLNEFSSFETPRTDQVCHNSYECVTKHATEEVFLMFGFGGRTEVCWWCLWFSIWGI